MSNQTKLMLAAVVAVVLGMAVVTWVSNARLRSMEREVEAATQTAHAKEEAAAESETRAAEYEQKIEYLESEIAGIGQIARRQDEELEKSVVDVNSARRDVERAKRLRSIDGCR